MLGPGYDTWASLKVGYVMENANSLKWYQKTKTDGIGLYIHIPFCERKCDYCDFLSFAGSSQEKRTKYVESLCKEIVFYGSKCQQTIKTVYFGGGTPSVLSQVELSQLINTIKESFILAKDLEWTMEVNPGTGSMDLFVLMAQMGINRVSMGLQTSQNNLLRSIGRIHTYERFLETYHDLREAGIDNISVDLMFGLPNQSLMMWDETVAQVIQLKPKHLSVYSLIIEETTPFYDKASKGLLTLPSEEEERSMFYLAKNRLEAAGYHQYEISNYALDGYKSQHNNAYWNLVEYYGLGLGASSYLEGIRYKNTSSLESYLDNQGAYESIRYVDEAYSHKAALEEFFFLGLRQLDGVSLTRAYALFGDQVHDAFDLIIENLMKEGLLIRNQDMIKLTPRGLDLANQVMVKFLID